MGCEGRPRSEWDVRFVARGPKSGLRGRSRNHDGSANVLDRAKCLTTLGATRAPLEPDIRDALAVAGQILELVQAVEVIDGNLGNGTWFSEA